MQRDASPSLRRSPTCHRPTRCAGSRSPDGAIHRSVLACRAAYGILPDKQVRSTADTLLVAHASNCLESHRDPAELEDCRRSMRIADPGTPSMAFVATSRFAEEAKQSPLRREFLRLLTEREGQAGEARYPPIPSVSMSRMTRRSVRRGSPFGDCASDPPPAEGRRSQCEKDRLFRDVLLASLLFGSTASVADGTINTGIVEPCSYPPIVGDTMNPSAQDICVDVPVNLHKAKGVFNNNRNAIVSTTLMNLDGSPKATVPVPIAMLHMIQLGGALKNRIDAGLMQPQTSQSSASSTAKIRRRGSSTMIGGRRKRIPPPAVPTGEIPSRDSSSRSSRSRMQA